MDDIRNMIQYRNTSVKPTTPPEPDRPATALPALTAAEIEMIAAHTADALRDLTDQDTLAPATRRAYGAALRYWNAWAIAAFGVEIALMRSPRETVSADTVLAFIAHHVAVELPDGSIAAAMPEPVRLRMLQLHAFGVRRAGHAGGDPALLSLASLRHRLASLQACHRLAGLVPAYIDDPRVRQAIRALGNRTARIAPALLRRPKTAIRRDMLNAMLANCASDTTPVGVRDTALLRVAFGTGGRRRAELASLHIEDLARHPDGWMWRLRESKGKVATDAGGAVMHIPVIGRTAAALIAWIRVLRALGAERGAVFRRLRNLGGTGASEWCVGEPMRGHDIWKVVRHRAAACGFDPNQFGAHSLRSGAATTLLDEGGALADASTLLGHSRMETTRQGYDRRGMPEAAIRSLDANSQKNYTKTSDR